MARYEPKDMDGIIRELSGQNDRAAISVGGSILEYALELAIESRLRVVQDANERGVLFSDNGIIGTFYEKIWMAYFLNLIGPAARRDIDLIRRIRNEVSHNMNPVSFDLAAISSRCAELEFAKQSIPGQQIPPDARGKFIFTVHFFVSALMLRACDSTPQIREAAENIGKYLDL
jgi:hypothetical protein